MIKVGSDCSGIGSFLQALERLGVDYVESFSCDFDYYARLVYCLNFGTESDLELAKSKESKYFCTEVKEIALKKGLPTSEELEILKAANDFAKKFSFYYPFNMYDREIPNESCDIYIGSFPCQAFSLSGKRLGEKDKRGIVFYSGHEFIQKNLPRYFIIENVKGLLSDEGGKTFNNWLELLGGKSINGRTIMFPNENSVPYHIHYQVLNAKHYGVPQNRERVFIIGIRDDEDNNFKFPKRIPLERRLKDVLENSSEFETQEHYQKYMHKYYLSEKMVEGFIRHGNRHDEKGTGFAWSPRDVNESASCIRANAALAPTDNTIVEGFINQDTQESTVFSEDGISPSICAGTHGYANGYVESKIGAIRGRESEDGIKQMLEINENETSNAITTVQKDNVVVELYGDKRLNQLLNEKEIPEGVSIIDTYNKSVNKKNSPTIKQNINSANSIFVAEKNVIVEFNLSGGKWDKTHEQSRRVYNTEGISPTIQTMGGGNQEPKILTDEPKYVKIPANNKKGFDIAEEEDTINFSNPNSETRRGRVGHGVSQTIETSPNQGIYTNQRIRKLTPKEVYRLMDFNTDFIEKTISSGLISDSQLYKTGGNSIVVACLAAIIKNLKF